MGFTILQFVVPSYLIIHYSFLILHYLSMLTIYTKDNCPYCILAKNLLTSLGATYQEIDITTSPEIIMNLVKKSGMRTVPQIFI